MSDIELAVKNRDHHQALADAWNEYIEKKAPKEEEKSPWDPSKVKWVQAEGTKGPYEKANPQATDDFKNMLADLKAHQGKLTRGVLFYWVFTDQATVGRKKSSK
jgi:hypothetical protein